MKTTVIFTVAALVFMLSACQNTVDEDLEKKAIIQVINEETQAYMDVDFDKTVSYFTKDSLTIRLGVGADDINYFEGWEAIAEEYRKDLLDEESNPDNSHIKVTKNDFKIKLYETTAYVTCTEKWIYELGDTSMEIDSRQIRFMEKVDNEWKIAFLAYIGTSGYEEETELEEMGYEFNTVPSGTAK